MEKRQVERGPTRKNKRNQSMSASAAQAAAITRHTNKGITGRSTTAAATSNERRRPLHDSRISAPAHTCTYIGAHTQTSENDEAGSGDGDILQRHKMGARRHPRRWRRQLHGALAPPYSAPVNRPLLGLLIRWPLIFDLQAVRLPPTPVTCHTKTLPNQMRRLEVVRRPV